MKIVAEPVYVDYPMKYKDLEQNNNKNGVTMTLYASSRGVGCSPKFMINEVIMFQAQYLYDLSRHFDGKLMYYVFFKFCNINNNPNLLVNCTSKSLNFENKQVICDNSWHLMYGKYIDIMNINLAFDLELSISQCSVYNICEQNVKQTMVQKMLNVFAPLHDDDEFADFELRGDDGAVVVHKAVLAAASPVLRRMLSGTWKETTEGYIKIPDTTKSVLQSFKSFIYLHTLPESGLEKLLILASYYIMPELEQKCVEKLTSSLNAENIYEMLEFATKNKLTRLALAIMEDLQSGKVLVKDISNHVIETNEVEE